jgi:hypothetical protein
MYAKLMVDCVRVVTGWNEMIKEEWGVAGHMVQLLTILHCILEIC